MEKQFVTYPITLALKELGFNDFHRFGWYIIEDGTEFGKSLHVSGDEAFYFNPEYCIKAPLWQQVIDYFRTKHNIVIELTRFEHTDDVVEWAYIIEKWDGNVIVEYHDCEHFATYEEAREAAILEAIKLVKENKK
jgi:hypothetical protein